MTKKPSTTSSKPAQPELSPQPPLNPSPSSVEGTVLGVAGSEALPEFASQPSPLKKVPSFTVDQYLQQMEETGRVLSLPTPQTQPTSPPPTFKKPAPPQSPSANLLPVTVEALEMLKKVSGRLIFDDAQVTLSDLLIEDPIRWTGDNPMYFVNEIISAVHKNASKLDAMIRAIEDHNGYRVPSADVAMTLMVRAAALNLFIDKAAAKFIPHN